MNLLFWNRIFRYLTTLYNQLSTIIGKLQQQKSCNPEKLSSHDFFKKKH